LRRIRRVAALAGFAGVGTTGLAHAQIIAVGPFRGVQTESFETQPGSAMMMCLEGGIFGGHATLCAQDGFGITSLSEDTVVCTQTPRTGETFVTSFNNAILISFNVGSFASTFGGYFGTETGVDGGMATFFDVDGGVIGTAPIATSGCGWVWNGWTSDAPVASVLLASNYTNFHDFLNLDDLEYLPAGTGPGCGSPDFDCDGDPATDADIEAFFACLAGDCPPLPCQASADFNGDGDAATDADIEAFFRVLAGGSC
jgi:hypothetical protein